MAPCVSTLILTRTNPNLNPNPEPHLKPTFAFISGTPKTSS